MIYALLRGVAGVALRWYYANVSFVGETRGLEGPLLVVVNHPNALVDVLVAGRAVPRRLMFTAKATLFANPVAAAALGRLGVLPLRRASDEGGSATVDRTRNAAVFEAITAALARDKAILIFPEGKSHDEPGMSPLRSGAARMALQAREAGVRGLRILPIGLVFERKEAPRSRILAIVGDPMRLDDWAPAPGRPEVPELTAEIDRRLRAVTLNYATVDEARADAELATLLAALVRYEAPPLARSADLRERTAVARLLPALRAAVAGSTPDVTSRAEVLQRRIAAFASELAEHRISLDDLAISRGIGPGGVFVAREFFILLVAGPLALWGWVNHLLPFRAALAAGRRVRHSAADPAMRTILAGITLVATMYVIQGAVVTLAAGPWVGLAYVASLPIAADVNLRLRERIDRARRRARTYLLFRSRPEMQSRLEREARELRAEALSLGAELLPGVV